MARYRKIEVRMWIDQKFRSLSAPPPNARDCWIYLLTNPDTSAIPGIYRAREEAMARDLGWPLKGFREAFREVFAKGMAKADWEAGLVFIPNAAKHNPPESPNVIKAWRAAWDELPECALKNEALQHLKGFAEGLPKGFQEVFRQVFGKSMPNQEQEQEQEQEQDQEQEEEEESASPPPTAEQSAKRKRKTDREPLPFTIATAVKALSDAATDRVALAHFDPALAARATALVRKHPDLPKWQLAGEYLAAGALHWLKEPIGWKWLVGAQNLDDLISAAESWDRQGRQRVNGSANGKAHDAPADIRRGQVPLPKGF